MKFTLFFCFLLISFNAKSEQSITTVSYPPPLVSADVRNQYFIEIMKLALEKTVSTHGAYQLKPAPVKMQKSRALHELSKGREVNIVWSMTSLNREKLLLPIRIPLLKGALGLRIPIIRKEDATKFNGISTLNQLRKFHAGQGHDWPDTSILRHNGLPVVTSTDYDRLFTMLKTKRFDYFPRSIAEAKVEINSLLGDGLIIEPTILLYYHAPVYFFTSKNNLQLAGRIEKGLLKAIADGSFEEIFNQHMHKRAGISKQQITNRTLIRLNNPFLSAKTPLSNKKLWLDWINDDLNSQRSAQ